MSAKVKYLLVLASLVLSLATAAAGVALGELRACLGAFGSFALTCVLYPKTSGRALQAIDVAYVAFATWALNVCFVGTVAVTSALFLAGWLLDQAELLTFGLWAAAYGIASLLLISLTLRSRSRGSGKAPQGLPGVEAAQREAYELILFEWGDQEEP